MYEGPYPRAFYRALHGVVHKEFRIRKATRELARSISRPGSFRGAHLRQAAGLRARAATLPVDRVRLRRMAKDRQEEPLDPPVPTGSRA